MIRDLGIVKPGSTLYIPFHTYDSNDPSASTTITGLATTDIEIYKDGSVTQRASDAGYALLDTDGIDFDGITGIHGLSIDLSDNTTSNFYAAGSQYWVVLSSITVDAATINTVLCTFTIGYPDAALNTTIATYTSQTSFTLTAGSADNDAYNGWACIAHDVASDIQMQLGVVSDYVGSTKTVTLESDPGIFTMAAGDNISLIPAFLTSSVDANVTQISGDATAADNAESFFDGTGYAGTNNVIPTVTTVSNGVSLAAGAVTNASLAGNMEVVFETDFSTNYNATRNAWATNVQDTVGTGNLPADAIAISGDTTAADNLEAMYDGTGYEDDTAPASRSQVAGIGASSGGAFNFAATGDNTGGAVAGATFVGTVDSGTFASTSANDGTPIQIQDTTNDIDYVLTFNVGAVRTATSVNIVANVNGNTDEMAVRAYDHAGTAWETIGTLSGTGGSAYQTLEIGLLSDYTSAAGDVYIRFDTLSTTPSLLQVDLCQVSGIANTAITGYQNGSVYVDEDNGTSTGTTVGDDATVTNRANDFDNAQTVADALSIPTITNTPGNSITLTAALQGYTVNNVQCTLNGGSQNVDSTRINGGFLAGTWARAGTGVPTFSNCNLNNVTSDRVACLNNCGILGTFTLTEAGVYVFNDAQAAGATSLATIDFASLGGATVSMQRWSGDLTITGMASGDTLNLNCTSGGTITLGGANGTVNISGPVASVTDNRTGSPTLNDNSVNLANINTEADTAISDAALATAASVSALNDLSAADVNAQCDTAISDAALATAANLATVDANVDNLNLGIIYGTAQTGTLSTTVATTDLTGYADDELIGRVIIFTGGTADGQASDITDYASASGTITYTAITTAPANGDTFKVV